MTLANSLTSSPQALAATAHSRTTSELSNTIVVRSTTANPTTAQSAHSATSIKL